MRLIPTVLAFIVPLVMTDPASAAVIQVPSAQAPTITVAINIAQSGDEIVVAPGIYFESISLNGKTLTLRSSAGPETTVIDGLGQFKPVIRVITSEGSNTLIEGFTIRNGVATAAAPGDRGAGIYCNLTSPTISNCIFINNQAVTGGAFYANGGSPKIVNCAFIDNTAVTTVGDGAAIYANNSSVSVTDCSFEGNVATRFGGAVRSVGTTGMAFTRCAFIGNDTGSNGGAFDIASGANAFTFRDCRFLDNRTLGSGTGGAVNIASATAVNHVFVNCVFDGNSSGGDGGAMNVLGRAELINCTFAQNATITNGGAVRTNGSGILLARNCIVWSNIPTGFSGPNLTVTHTCHQTAITGLGNFVADPKFVSLASGDLRLASDSPCIDAGNTALLPSIVATDIDGLARAVNVASTPTGVAAFGYFIDLGAFEFPAAVAPSACPGDLDGDGSVGPSDLATLLGSWGLCN